MSVIKAVHCDLQVGIWLHFQMHQTRHFHFTVYFLNQQLHLYLHLHQLYWLLMSTKAAAFRTSTEVEDNSAYNICLSFLILIKTVFDTIEHYWPLNVCVKLWLKNKWLDSLRWNHIILRVTLQISLSFLEQLHESDDVPELLIFSLALFIWDVIGWIDLDLQQFERWCMHS